MPTVAPALRRRLLADIAEVQQDPYPNTHLYINESDITCACLILTPPEQQPLHLKVQFSDKYPLSAPTVTCQSRVDHPNVFSWGICASILNTADGWTPAYTLKGLMIQLLSFFLSDRIEQNHGIDGEMVDLASRRARMQADYKRNPTKPYECHLCVFGQKWSPPVSHTMARVEETTDKINTQVAKIGDKTKRSKLFELPDEVILNLLTFLDDPDIAAFSETLPAIKHMLTSYDFIRMRELQCFCLKKSFLTTKLGIGISISSGKKPTFRSEFDLLSNEAYSNFGVRKSIQGVAFQKWLPLPLSRRHWNLVRLNAAHALEGLRVAAKMQETDKIAVLYHMMNTIVVQFSSDAARSWAQPDARSTLSHASEKAVESYFALFHLLLCFATESPITVNNANRMVTAFLTGPRTKAQFPDLGQLLVAALISDAGLTQELTSHIIKEAVLRNVVWMLDRRGAGMAEMAYLEPTPVSDYRLQKTFEASKISYRLLMFLRLFSSAARPQNLPIAQLKEQLFDTHSAPPPGVSANMAAKIRAIHSISSFPQFFAAMGVTDQPSKSKFSSFLRSTITESVNAGYSAMPLSQSQLYMLRKVREPFVEQNKDVQLNTNLENWYERDGKHGNVNFFPQLDTRNGARGGGWRGR